MTGQIRETPQRRADDRGWFARARAWWQRNGPIIMGPILLAVGVAVVVVAFQVKDYSESRSRDAAAVKAIAQQQAAQQKATAAAAKLQCLRSREYGPAFADYFERVGVFTAKAADEYRASIPKTCPK